METRAERRLRKLRQVIREKAEGSITRLAADTNLSVGNLIQIDKGTLLPKKVDGTRSPRAVGDDLCRTIEDRYNLGRGWFDSDEDSSDLPPDALSVARQFNAVTGPSRAILFAGLQAQIQNTVSMVEALKLGQPIAPPPPVFPAEQPGPSPAPNPAPEPGPQAGQ